MMERVEVQAWLNAYGDAWERGDPQALVALFTADARYQETPFEPPMIGTEAIGAYWKAGAGEGQTDVTFQSQLLAVEGDAAFATWQAKFRRVPTGALVELDGAFHLHFADRQARLRCRALKEWWHRRETPAS